MSNEILMNAAAALTATHLRLRRLFIIPSFTAFLPSFLPSFLQHSARAISNTEKPLARVTLGWERAP